jgi:TRAP-type C4-dicarboxylate transport system permease small subunit
VFIRYVLNQNTIWQTDFVTWSLVAATFIGSPYVLLTRGHVNVDVLPHYLGRRARFWLAVFSAVIALAFCLVMTVLTFLFWQEAWENNWVSDSMWRARLWIPYGAMPVGLGILSLQYVADLFNLLAGREPPFGMSHEPSTIA